MSLSTRQTSWLSTALGEGTRLGGHAISFSTRERRLWYMIFNHARRRLTLQLDAGMHPAKEGFSALPFFDEFDLSTVDILLISQYVSPIALCM